MRKIEFYTCEFPVGKREAVIKGAVVSKKKIKNFLLRCLKREFGAIIEEIEDKNFFTIGDRTYILFIK